MDATARSAMRGADGRFLPGHSGNPAGKRPGTRNRATLVAEALRRGEEAPVRRAIDRALQGDGPMLRFCVARLFARPRNEAVAPALPKGARAGDLVAAFDATLAAMAAGEITPEEALRVTRILDRKRRALAAVANKGKPALQRKPSPQRGEGRVRGLTQDSKSLRSNDLALTPTLSRTREREIPEAPAQVSPDLQPACNTAAEPAARGRSTHPSCAMAPRAARRRSTCISPASAGSGRQVCRGCRGPPPFAVLGSPGIAGNRDGSRRF